MLKGFKKFLVRGNAVDLAVGVVIGGAFQGVVQSLVKDIITPVLTIITGSSNKFSSLSFVLAEQAINYGELLNAVISFILIAAAIYFFVITPLNKLTELTGKREIASTKTCGDCLSDIPTGARKCRFCGALQTKQV